MNLSRYTKEVLRRAYLLGVHLILNPQSNAAERHMGGLGDTLVLALVAAADEGARRALVNAIGTELETRFDYDLTYMR